MEENISKKNHTKRDVITMLAIVVVIVLLLLHNCVFQGKNKEKNNNGIDICDGDDCETKPGGKDILINCMNDSDNSVCLIPSFIGKTEEDIQEWLDKISNNIDITFQVYDSSEKDGIVIDQSNDKNLTVKYLLDNNIPLVITFANSRETKVDCLQDLNNKNCVVPDFTGMTKKDVYDWLNKLSNNLPITFNEQSSKKSNGTIINQSFKKGTKVKNILESGQNLDISFSNSEKVNCISDDKNPVCMVPNFTGKTEKEINDWLDSISNAITLRYENEESNAKNKTVLRQDVKPGTSIKQLINNNTPIKLTFAQNESDGKVNCLKDINNSACKLPNFVGSTKEDIENWLNNISNAIPIRYVTSESDENTGIIINQSINNGTTVKDILEKNNQLVITVSKKKQETKPNQTTEPEPEPEPTPTPEPEPQKPENVEPEPEPEPEPIPEEEKDKVVIKDSNVVWDVDTEANIFKNSLADTKIAPESSNTYRFSINNNTEYNVKYTMTFEETNDYNINMKYKLRKNNSYIIDHYVSISEINIEEQLLNSGKNDTFYLEWKWIGSDNDMEIGQNPSASYRLKIKVEAESIDE